MCDSPQKRRSIDIITGLIVATVFSLEFLNSCSLFVPTKSLSSQNKNTSSTSLLKTNPSDGLEINVLNIDNGFVAPPPFFPARAQLSSLPSPKLEVNHEVRREISNYLRSEKTISNGLNRLENLFPVMGKIFVDEGLPEELLNLALIESGIQTEANSQAGAIGIWQFMSGTARLHGLEVSSRVDERKDPILSTIAAAHYLKELYSKFNDWYLVLAAYNAGEGAVAKAIQQSGRSDYWGLARSGAICAETTRFVPRFIAASILQKLYSRYGKNVQLAQYLERHVVLSKVSGNNSAYAFNIENEALLRNG